MEVVSRKRACAEFFVNERQVAAGQYFIVAVMAGDVSMLLGVQTRLILWSPDKEFRMILAPLSNGLARCTVAKRTLREMVVVELGVALDRCLQILARAESRGRQDVADASVEGKRLPTAS